MTRPIRPEVCDHELRAALERVGDHIENYTANLDSISHDIRKIEEYLSASGIRLTATVVVSVENVLEFDASVVCQTEEQIQWRPSADERQERWRLMYLKQSATCEPGDLGRLLSGPDEVEFRPLIETSVAVRLRAHKLLPKLVIAVGELVEVRSLLSVTDKDIPF